MGVSVWGVDHGPEEIRKDKAYPKPKKAASGGRIATGVAFPGWHGAIAGRQGRKLRSAGMEVGGSLGGQVAGGAVNALARGHAPYAPVVGGWTGAGVGTNVAHNKGYLKAQGS